MNNNCFIVTEPGYFFKSNEEREAEIVEGALLVTEREDFGIPVSEDLESYYTNGRMVKIPAGSALFVLEKFGRPNASAWDGNKTHQKTWACIVVFNGAVLEVNRTIFHNIGNPCNEISLGSRRSAVATLSFTVPKKQRRPDGAVSTLAKNSGGIEPVFSPFYNRKLFSGKRRK